MGVFWSVVSMVSVVLGVNGPQITPDVGKAARLKKTFHAVSGGNNVENVS